MTFSERLRVPLSFWVIGLFFGLSAVTGMTFALGDAFVLPATLVAAGLIGWALVAYGSLSVVVDDHGLRVGRSLLEWPYIGAVQVLDETETRSRLGAGSDHRAFLAVRPYLGRCIQVDVADPADPHPFWLVSSRRPSELAAALSRGRSDEGRAR